MKNTILFVLIVCIMCFFGCEEAPNVSTDLPITPSETVDMPEVTEPVQTRNPETEPSTEPAEQIRVYVPQDPDPDTYPQDTFPATVVQYMGLMYVRDNREGSFVTELPEDYVWIGTVHVSEQSGRPVFDLEACHIPAGASLYGSLRDPDFLYYSSEKGWQRLIRAGLVENYWDSEEDPYQVSGNVPVQWFQSLLNSYRQYNLYNHALETWFETAEDVDVCALFRNGIPEERARKLSGSEVDFLNSNGFGAHKPAGNAVRLPVKTMDAELKRFFGVGFEEISGVGLDSMDAYWRETNCYYKWCSDVSCTYPNVVSVTAEAESGCYTVIYYLEASATTKIYGELHFRKQGDTLQLLSNCPIEPVL